MRGQYIVDDVNKYVRIRLNPDILCLSITEGCKSFSPPGNDRAQVHP